MQLPAFRNVLAAKTDQRAHVSEIQKQSHITLGKDLSSCIYYAMLIRDLDGKETNLLLLLLNETSENTEFYFEVK